MLRVILPFFLNLILTTVVFSQTQGDYQSRQYSTENGLPSNGIKGLQWDEKTGFLWIATEAGIVRFNGIDFKTYTKRNTPFIASERMLYLVRNNAGDFIAADELGNIFVAKLNRLSFLRKANEDSVYNNQFALVVSNILFQKKIPKSGFQPFTIGYENIVPIGDTACLMLSSQKLYYYSLHSQRPEYLQVGQEPLTAVFKSNKNIFIINKSNEIFLLKNITEKPLTVSLVNEGGIKTGFPQKGNLFFWENGMENAILINGKNAWCLAYKNEQVIASLICTEIPENALIKYIQYSKKRELLFLGTESKGLTIISRNSVKAMKASLEGSNVRNTYYTQVELSNGSVLTNEGYIVGLNENPAKDLPITGRFGYSIYLTADSLLWFLQDNCLKNYDYKTLKTTAYPLINGHEFLVMQQCKGQLYVASDWGIALLSGDSLRYVHRYSKNDRMGNRPYAMIEMQPGIMALATCNALMQFNTATAALDTLFSIKNSCIRSMRKYHDYLFFGTYGKGYYIFKDGLVKAMPLDKNNYLSYLHCFVPDDSGYCWMSTNRGLFKAKIEDMIDAFEHNRTEVYYHYYGRNDGMDITEMNGGCTPCAVQLINKTISFPTMDGLLWVNPQNALTKLPGGPVYFDEILADNTLINPDSLQKIVMAAGTNEIIIKLGFAAWCNTENIYLAYKLNNSPSWKLLDINKDASITLSNLPAGDYTLHIRKIDGFGTNNFTYKYLVFSILLPWYKQWWIYVLIALLLSCLATILYRLRVKQFKINQHQLERRVALKTKDLIEKNEALQKIDSVKTRLISIISHDIVTPLKFINLAGKNLLEKRKSQPDDPDLEVISEIANTSKELQLLSTNILNWIKYQNEQRRLVKDRFNAHDMVQQVLGLLNSIAKEKQLPLINEVSKDLFIYQFFEPVKIIIYNLVSNAINFTEKGSIVINCSHVNGSICISVKDTGLGMTAEQIKNIMADEFIISSVNIDNRKGNGLGYLIIKDLLEMIEGSLLIRSEKGRGAIIEVTFIGKE
ncbi:MAG: ATP-binding protein [Chitinophagaceae bacterium]